MKILIPVFGFGKQGGYRVLSNLANTWIELGHEVTFLSITDSDYPNYPTTAKILWVDRKGNFLDGPRSEIKSKYKFFHDIISLYKGLKSLKNEEFDVILANQSHTTFPIHFAKLKSLKAYYIQADEVGTQLALGGYKNYVLSFLSRISYSLDFLRIVNAPLYLNYKYIKAKDYVYPAMDFDIFHPDDFERKDLSKKKLVIGCIGRIAAWKGTDDVIEAFKLLKADNFDLELKIAFGNEELANVDGISIVYPKNDRELAGFYKSLDILIAPGKIQLGAVHYPVIEAMACRVAVITTGYYPAREDNAWIVKIGDPFDIVDKIKRIANDELYNEKINRALEDVKDLSWYNSSIKMINCFENEIINKGI
ncbi:glycosyltransferase family 4 protein [Chryseobacterium gwangjuense]|uniref:glycosyltransferase family 4 protein n=1 Tax=Chryseobacterium gwangjuense TaxID=1069980 RepID=UPI001E463970|nr:glycosyltransferase family 4 protein [Chryseobacterium gwangjuense]MCE3076898.1 glycosyltransferase family 4 protein [Chryseobacterium gwangjuense]